MPKFMMFLSFYAGAGALLVAGCSSPVDGRQKTKKGAVLTYSEDRLPGVRHAARPGDLSVAPGSPSQASPNQPAAPRVCNEKGLAAEAAAELDTLLADARKGADRPLPPARAVHLNPTGLGRYLAAGSRRKPGLARTVRSLRASRKIRIRYAPDHDAEEVGVLARHSRIPTYGFVSRRGCRAGWMALGPHAYVCSSRLQSDRRPPELQQYPKVKRDRITPGVYGYIRRGGAPAYASRSDAANKVMTRRLPGGFFIRFGRFTRIANRNFWKTTKGLYVPISNIARHVPSKYHGYVLERDNLKLPVAVVRHKGPGKRGIPVYHAPGSGRVVGQLKRYTAVAVIGTKVVPDRRRRKARYWRVGRCQWIRARSTRLAHAEAPPPGIRQGERWIDVDLASQTLVAYEGTKPVFVTLISTGKKKHETRHGVFRVYWKISEVDMANESGANEEYLAESVPWSMFFWKGQALHGAYWHDDFGRVKSHGCINLSPMDARYLFEWTQPSLPPGWRHAWHGERFPGPAVRIRRRRGERPRLLGLARKFAPAAAVAARDRDYKERVRRETIKMFGGNPEEGATGEASGDTGDTGDMGIPGAKGNAKGAKGNAKGAKDNKGAQGPNPAVATAPKPPPRQTPRGALMPVRRVRKSITRPVRRVVRRPAMRPRRRRSGGLVPIMAPTPPPPGRRR